MNFSPPNCIRTFTGKDVNIFNPEKEMFCIEDISWALSKEQRYGNHLRKYYSVAQHSIICSELAPKEDKYSALCHEFSEAYMNDVPSPQKNHEKFQGYREVEDNLMKFLSGMFGFQYPFTPKVVEIDAYMAKLEWNCLMLGNEPFKHVLLNQQTANKKFLQLFKELSNQ